MSADRHTILFDDRCGLCRRALRLVKHLDWFHRFKSVGRCSRQAQEFSALVKQHDLQRSIHVVTTEGNILSSVRALRFLGLRLPLTALLALLLYVPGTLPPAERAYAWVSRHRRTDQPAGADNTCARCGR